MSLSGTDWMTRMLAREGVMLVPVREIRPNDLMIRVIAPDTVTPSGWTLLREGVVVRRAMSGDESLWPQPDYVLREILGRSS